MSVTTVTPRQRATAILTDLVGGVGARASAKRGALGAFAIRIGSAGLAYLSQVLLARWMGVHEYGLFAYCWVWLTMLGIIAPLGLNSSVLRFVPEYASTGKLDLLRGLLRESRVFSVAAATVFAIVGAGIVYATDGVIGPDYMVPLILMLICLPMFALIDTQEGIARARNWIDLALIPPYIVRPALLLILLAGALWFGLETTASTAVLCAIGATWITAVGQTVLLQRRLTRQIEPGPRSRATRLWITVSIPILLVEGFFTVLANTDVIVLNVLVGASEAGIYYAALKTTTLISFIYYAITTVFAHRFAEHHAARDQEALTGVARDAVNWVFWPSLAAAAGILALGWPLLWLFGEAFTAAYPVMFVLVIGLLVKAAFGPVEYMLSMAGEERACASALAFAVAANIALNIALIPLFGIMGAAAATAVSTGLATLLMARLVRRRLGIDMFVLSGGAVTRPDRAEAGE